MGRGGEQAYAYLLIPPEQTLSPIARKRLAAIREFSDLGSGFRIAALDLEIRGAGNLLGGQQSGRWVITDGLKAGEQVMVDGFQKLQMMPPGTPVKAVPWTPAK